MASPQISRRDFLALAGLTSASAGCPAMAQALKAKDPDAGLKTFQATCSMECLHCNLKAFVKDGKVVKISNANAFDGKPCARGLSRIKWLYAENRVLHPMKRVGERGEGKFVAITWDEALDTIAGKIKEAIAKDGSQSLLFTSASGNMDNLHNPAQVAFGNYLGGTTRTLGSLCCSAVTAAMMPIVGMRYVDTRDTIDQAKYILCWGNNPLVTIQAYWHLYLKAKERGAKIVVIDPRKSETAVRADKWVSIIPGTDTALGLGMIRWIAANGKLDKPFLKQHTGAVYLVDKDGKLMREDARIRTLIWSLTKNLKNSSVMMPRTLILHWRLKPDLPTEPSCLWSWNRLSRGHRKQSRIRQVFRRRRSSSWSRITRRINRQ